MTSTDRAFIAAYQQSTISLPAVESEEHPPAPPGGPHFLRKNSPQVQQQSLGEKRADVKSSRRAPLSELIAQRHQRFADMPPALAASPTLELSDFNWPEVSTRLAREYGSALIAALSSISGNIVTLVGAHPGVGLTTMALALAQATTRADLRVALVDANPVASDLAFQMGVRRLRTLAEAAEQGDTLEGCVVSCRGGSVSLVIAGGPIPPKAARQSLDQLSAANDLVIVDAGAATVPFSAPLSSWLTTSEGISLVDQPDRERDDLLRSFAGAQLVVHGIIENFVDA